MASSTDSPGRRDLTWGALAGLVLLTVTSVLVVSRLLPEHPQAGLAVGIGLGLLVLAVMRPQWVLLTIVAMIPLDSFARLSESLKFFTLFKVLFPLVLGGLLLGRLSGRFDRLSRHPLDLWVLLFVTYQVLLIPIAYDSSVALDQVRRVMSMALLYYVTSRLLVEEVWQGRLVRCIVYVSAVSAVFSLITYLSGTNPYGDTGVAEETVRATGAAAISPNVFGLLMIPALFLSWSLALKSSSRPERMLQPLLALLFLSGIALSFSRSAVLTLVICGVVMIWLWGNRLRGGHYAALLVTLALGLVAAPVELWERMGSLVDAATGSSDYSLWRRLNYLEVAGNIYADHPWLGAGPGNFRILHALPAYQTEPSLIGVPRPPHNVYVQTLSEQGPVGLALYLGILYSAMRASLTHWRRSEMSVDLGWQASALFLSFTAFSVMGMFSHILLEKLFWVLLALVRVLPRPDP